MVVFGDWMGTSSGFDEALSVGSRALAPSRAVAIGQLRYREDSLGIALRPFLGRHRGEQAQIVAFDGKTAALRLEVADGAMPVQNEWRCFPTVADRSDLVNYLTRSANMVTDLHGSVVGTIAVNQCSGVGQNPGTLRQREGTKT